MDITDDIKLNDHFTQIQRGWWLILVFAIIGGLIGLAISYTFPPIYETHSELHVVMDLSSIDTENWTDLDFDYVNNRSASIVYSNKIIHEIIDSYQEMGILVEGDAFFLDRRLSTWGLVVRYPDPQIAAELSNAWQDLAYTILIDATKHALKAREIEQQLNILTTCSNQETPDQFCANILSFENLSQQISSLYSDLWIEEQDSLGISSVISIDKGSRAEPPTNPVWNNRSTSALIGLILGCLGGVLILIMKVDFLKSWKK